ncbi:MAG TPA: nucleoside hydrolase-like domain-containing protein, partial [Bryobacteraceae bacterium]|nr:nucleoside hydrolase-like domain-containing protein [Bryobacteraceae bacterium]
ANVANKRHMLDAIDVYAQVQPNLRKHDKAYPSAEDLRRVVKQGLSGTYGKPAADILGEGKDSEASNYIIELIDRKDPEPIWFCFWGGTQELAQALWKARRERNPDQLAQFVSRIRVYMIAEQDGSGKWLKDEFPDLFTITSLKAFSGMGFTANDATRKTGDLAWLNEHVREGHGALGAMYPRSGWRAQNPGVIEGDSPSFLYLLSERLGLSHHDHPDWGGWGGRFVARSPKQWFDSPEGRDGVARWHDARQRDFAARMDWCLKKPDQVNHAPAVTLNGDNTQRVLTIKAIPGQTVPLTAAARDRDGNAVSYHWWVYREAGTYRGDVTIVNGTAAAASLTIPGDASKATMHVVLEVTDDGSPALTTYRRAVLTVE